MYGGSRCLKIRLSYHVCGDDALQGDLGDPILVVLATCQDVNLA